MSPRSFVVATQKKLRKKYDYKVAVILTFMSNVRFCFCAFDVSEVHTCHVHTEYTHTHRHTAYTQSQTHTKQTHTYTCTLSTHLAHTYTSVCVDIIIYTYIYLYIIKLIITMASRSSSSVVMMTALVFTWFSYFLLWLCFPSRIPTAATAESIAAAPSVLVKQRVEYPARSDGVIFVSHAASGPAREAVYVLARFGYQVVVGVKNDLERRSYLYSLRKGIELIQFDISDPSTYPTLIYRLRHIRRDLDRPIVGLLINLAGIIVDEVLLSYIFTECSLFPCSQFR